MPLSRVHSLTIDGVDVPPRSDYFVRVFLDKPDAGPGTPITDPHYAGSFGFFNDPMMTNMPGMGEAKAKFLVDLSGSLRRLNRAGSLAAGQYCWQTPSTLTAHPS